jgi:hypothetical protein
MKSGKFLSFSSIREEVSVDCSPCGGAYKAHAALFGRSELSSNSFVEYSSDVSAGCKRKVYKFIFKSRGFRAGFSVPQGGAKGFKQELVTERLA